MERDIEINYKNNEIDLDIQVANGDLRLGNELSNRIIISLFTWGPAGDGDEIPVGIKNGGYWGDNVVSRDSEMPENLGSRIWLACGKITDETQRLIESYARESLNWLNDEENIVSFDVSASRSGISQIDLTVLLTMANGEIQSLVYSDITNWGK